MAERKLQSRRRRADKGKSIRVSTALFKIIDKSRRGKSWDSFFRILFGIPDRAGNEQPLIEGMLETMTGRFFLKLPDKPWDKLEEDAYEIAIMTAAKRGAKRVSRPLKMRELP